MFPLYAILSGGGMIYGGYSGYYIDSFINIVGLKMSVIICACFVLWLCIGVGVVFKLLFDKYFKQNTKQVIGKTFSFRFIIHVVEVDNIKHYSISIKDAIHMKNPRFYSITDDNGLMHIFVRADLRKLAEAESLIKIEKETINSDECGVLQDDNGIFCNFNPDEDNALIKVALMRFGIRIDNGGCYKVTIASQNNE